MAEINPNITYVVSFSGGRSSAYMCWRLKREYSHLKMAFVYANTGKELEETLVFVQRCSDEFGLDVTWVEAVFNPQMGIGVKYKIVDFATAARKGEPFDAMVQKFGLPNKEGPFCTKELKTRPLTKWSRDNFGDAWVGVEGMRIDEGHRVKPGKVYPMVTWFPTWRIQVRLFWAGMAWDLGLSDYEGNCDLCWKKSLRKRLTILAEHPERGAQWQHWEEIDTDGYVFDRDGFTIAQLMEMSQKPFRRVNDELIDYNNSPQLFAGDWDAESSCTCD